MKSMVASAILAIFLGGTVVFAQGTLPTPTIFMVNGEPEKYAGKTVLFDRAVLLGGVVRRGDQYELQVANDRGARPDMLTFSLSRKLANLVNEEGRLPPNQPVHLTCRILKIDGTWHARVLVITFVGPDGQALKTFKE